MSDEPIATLDDAMRMVANNYDQMPEPVRRAWLFPVAKLDKGWYVGPGIVLPGGATPADAVAPLIKNKLPPMVEAMMSALDTWTYSDKVNAEFAMMTLDEQELFWRTHPPSEFPDRVDSTVIALVAKDGTKKLLSGVRGKPDTQKIDTDGVDGDISGRQHDALARILG